MSIIVFLEHESLVQIGTKLPRCLCESTSTLIEITKIQASEVRPIIFVEIDTNVPDFDSPNIEFVALNQTKYLVRTKGSEHFCWVLIHALIKIGV